MSSLFDFRQKYTPPAAEAPTGPEPEAKIEAESGVETRTPDQLAEEVLSQIETQRERTQTPSLTWAFNLINWDGVTPEVRAETEDRVFENFGITRHQVEFAQSRLLESRELCWVAIPSSQDGQLVCVGRTWGSDALDIYVRPWTEEQTQQILTENWLETSDHSQMGAIVRESENRLTLSTIEEAEDWPNQEEDPEGYAHRLARAKQTILRKMDRNSKVLLSCSVDAYPEAVRPVLYASIAEDLLGPDWQEKINAAERELDQQGLTRPTVRGERSLETTVDGVKLLLIRNTHPKNKDKFPFLQQLVGSDFGGKPKKSFYS